MSQESSYLMGKNNHKHDDGSLKILYNCRLVMLMILMMMRRRNLDDDLFNRIGIGDESFQKHNPKNPLPRRSSLFRPLLFWTTHQQPAVAPVIQKTDTNIFQKRSCRQKKTTKGQLKINWKPQCVCVSTIELHECQWFYTPLVTWQKYKPNHFFRACDSSPLLVKSPAWSNTSSSPTFLQYPPVDDQTDYSDTHRGFLLLAIP